MNKAELRAQMRAMRRALMQAEQEAAAQAVYARMKEFEPYRSARVVMAYMACRGELSLDKVIRDVLEGGKTLVLPRCEEDGVMTGRRVRAMSELVSGAYGLLEPAKTCDVLDPGQIELILVPGAAFDCAGHRLGQGAGYYDRYLPGTQAVTVGICHDFALLERVPVQAHDIPMDFVMTPGRTAAAQKHTTGGSDHGSR